MTTQDEEWQLLKSWVSKFDGEPAVGVHKFVWQPDPTGLHHALVLSPRKATPREAFFDDANYIIKFQQQTCGGVAQLPDPRPRNEPPWSVEWANGVWKVYGRDGKDESSTTELAHEIKDYLLKDHTAR